MTIRDLTPWNWFRSQDLTNQPSNMNIDTPLLGLQRDIDRIFNNFFQGFNAPQIQQAGINALIAPRINIAESNKSYQISAELPGVEEKDVDISVTNGVLNIKGERKEEKEEKDQSYHRIESSYGMFQRSLPLPENADQNNIKANFKNGILSVTIAKSAEALAKTKKISISHKAA